jgi:hypothetical protein
VKEMDIEKLLYIQKISIVKLLGKRVSEKLIKYYSKKERNPKK